MPTTPNQRRILFLSTGLSKGGAETQLVRLATELRNRNWAVGVVSMNGTCHFRNELDVNGIDFYPLDFNSPSSPYNLLESFRAAARITKKWKPDILVSFMYHANLLGSLLTLTTGYPSISSVRNEHFGGPLREWLAHFATKANVQVTINSSNAAVALIDRGVLPHDRTTVMPNAISVGPPRALGEFRAGNRMRWLAIGRLYPQKDYPNLLQAFRKVANELPDSQLRIAGSGPLESDLETLISDLQLTKNVEMLGQRDDVEMLLRQSDALVLSSAWEGMPNVVMEAMANGLPVVATDVGGVSELVVDRATGLLCEAREPAALATAMLSLAKAPPLERLALGEAGRQRVSDLYSIEAVCNRWESVLRDHVKASTRLEST